jgi:N-acetylneuraminate lyase
MHFRLSGLVAATFTPMHSDGSLNLAMARPVVEHLIRNGVRGLYVCGSTGEGPLLTTEERKATAAAYVEAAEGRLPVVVQVGHSSVVEARQLAAHAVEIGADAVSAVAPYYFKPGNVNTLADCLAEIAGGAPDLPFYYYHIPALSGVSLDMVELLQRVASKIHNFAGIKYTNATTDELQTLIALDDGRWDILFGRDEMLLGGLAAGAKGAVGSTYNFAAPLYYRVMAAFREGNIEEAQRLQGLAVKMVRIICGYRVHAGLKAIMGMLNLDCGPTRLPNVTLKTEEIASLRRELEAAGFFQWGIEPKKEPAHHPHVAVSHNHERVSGGR